MIVVKLMGGHSNQLFQYATARRLAERHKTELVLDISWFEQIDPNDTKRVYELDVYPLKARLANQKDLAIIKRSENEEPKVKKLLGRFFGNDLKLYRENGLGFNEAVMSLANNTILLGYFQCEKYFKDIRDELLLELEPENEPSSKNAELIERMKNSESVWLHFRRGDYITNKFANAFHGIKELAYYEDALKIIEKKVKDKSKIELFVSSNEIAWCKKNLKFPYPIYYIENELGSDDMRVAKHAKHDILANSSFSWWGGWLNDNPDKVVIAPKQWFLDKKSNQETDIVPDSWTRL
jgi:hypothetical protein